jgi:hypothetical protein
MCLDDFKEQDIVPSIRWTSRSASGIEGGLVAHCDDIFKDMTVDDMWGGQCITKKLLSLAEKYAVEHDMITVRIICLPKDRDWLEELGYIPRQFHLPAMADVVYDMRKQLRSVCICEKCDGYSEG